jgi:hypothetical protein
MEKLFDIGTWRSIVVESFSTLAAKLADLFPSIAGALLLLLFGWILGRVLRSAASRLLRGVGVDRAAVRLQISATLEQAGVHVSVSELVGRLLFWLVMLVFLLSAVETLGLTALSTTIDRLIGYLPNLVGGVLIFLVGLLLARFGATAAASAAAAAGIASARRLGVLVQAVLTSLVAMVAVEQLGIEITILIGPLTAVLAAAGLAAGLAFALGARPVITHILAGHFLKQSLPRDSFVEIDGRRGVVERVGPTDTVFRDGDKKWSLPNAQLLENVVQYHV